MVHSKLLMTHCNPLWWRECSSLKTLFVHPPLTLRPTFPVSQHSSCDTDIHSAEDTSMSLTDTLPIIPCSLLTVLLFSLKVWHTWWWATKVWAQFFPNSHSSIVPFAPIVLRNVCGSHCCVGLKLQIWAVVNSPPLFYFLGWACWLYDSFNHSLSCDIFKNMCILIHFLSNRPVIMEMYVNNRILTRGQLG